MSEAHHSVSEKVITIFRELVGDRAEWLRGDKRAFDAASALKRALAANGEPKIAAEVAFHLTDWNWDAAFLVAVHLFPERFTPDELATGVDMVLIHAPNHLAAAAKLGGHPADDIFGVGALDQVTEEGR